jgi:hypothetical protein
MRYLTALLCLLVGVLSAQQKTVSAEKPAAESVLVGDWKGTSICKARPGICHDEVVVYHFKPSGKSKNGYTLSADKIVNGELDAMGDLDCLLDAKASTVTCHYRADDTWTFKLDGDKIQGTLVIPNNVLLRVINVKKVKDWRKE